MSFSLYLGRLHPIKGIENLLRAVAALKGDGLSVCGEGRRLTGSYGRWRAN